MNPLALYMESGDSFYLGAVLLLVAISVSPFLKRSWLLRLRNGVAWIALALLVMASPPFAWIVDATFFLLVAFWLIAWNRAPGPAWVLVRPVSAFALFVLVVVLSILEFSHRRMPAITGVPSDHLVVIGDSLSSGIDPRAPAWPTVMQQTTGVPVKNLAAAGATSAEGKLMADKIASEDRVVLIEIGGNDLLTDVPCEVFGKNLQSILATVAVPGRTVVMFELPLLPNKIACGRYQRLLARDYRVALIPKRCLIGILGGTNATSDGLHLTDTGARRMAALVWKELSAVLKPPSTQSFTFQQSSPVF